MAEPNPANQNTLTYEGRLAWLFYKDDKRPFEPLRNMNVYIDIPHDEDFLLFHANTTDTGKLCTSADPGNPDVPARNNMWLEEGKTYQVYYEPEAKRNVQEIKEEECIASVLTIEDVPGLNSRCVLRVDRWYDDLEFELVGEDEAPFKPDGEGEITARLVDGEGQEIASQQLEPSGDKVEIRFENIPVSKDFELVLDGYAVEAVLETKELEGDGAESPEQTTQSTGA